MAHKLGDIPILGIHHMTAITADAQQGVDFYSGVLGLRLVKLTVNFDDPGAYHLYFGDGAGRPGTILTFFPYPHGRAGRVGPGQVTTTVLAVPPGSLGFWSNRLTGEGIAVEQRGDTLAFAAPDGLWYELAEVAGYPEPAAWSGAPVAPEHAVAGMETLRLAHRDPGPTDHTLTEVMGFRKASDSESSMRYQAGDGGPGTNVEVVTDLQSPVGQSGHGTVHHVAFRLADETAQRTWQRHLNENGYHVSPVMDRDYFRSIYFREPGGILFELATDPPGFTADESLDELGAGLKLPKQYEPLRDRILEALPRLRLPGGVTVGV